MTTTTQTENAVTPQDKTDQAQDVTNYPVGRKQKFTLEGFREYIEDNEILTIRDFNEHFRDSRHENLPSNPVRFYDQSWRDITGRDPNDRTVTREYLSVEEFRDWLTENDIVTSDEFKAFENRPTNVPSNPYRTYGKTWGEITGRDRHQRTVHREYRSVDDFRDWLIENDIVTIRDFNAPEAVKIRPDDVPSNPQRTYGISWQAITGRRRRDRDEATGELAIVEETPNGEVIVVDTVSLAEDEDTEPGDVKVFVSGEEVSTITGNGFDESDSEDTDAEGEEE